MSRKRDSAPRSDDPDGFLDPEREPSSPVCFLHLFEERADPGLRGEGETVVPGSRSCSIRLKRVYDAPSSDDGARILVDGIWPRGIRKSDAELDLWLRGVAPTSELRRWFGHDADKWPEFCRRYHTHLRSNGAAREAIRSLRERLAAGPVTLLFAARDLERNNAVALAEYLRKEQAGRPETG